MTLSIAMHCKLKHGKLFKAARKVGGQSALGRRLGVSPQTVGSWCNLKACPPLSWPAERLVEVEKILFELTGETLNDLFPAELRGNRDFLDSPKDVVIEQDVELAAIAAATSARLTLPSPIDTIEHAERRELVGSALRALSYRERKVLAMLHGIEDGFTYSLEEIGHVFKCTRERIRQIEAHANRHIREGLAGERLRDSGYVPRVAACNGNQ